jgi:predicted protein tyrosine phosphatase
MFLIALNRVEISSYNCNVPHVVVSITNPENDEVQLPQNPMRLGLIRLKFHDLEDDYSQNENLVISDQQAKDIVALFQTYRDKIESVIVNCEAGISRSAGCAAALSVLAGESDEKFFQGRYCPNKTVYRKILKAAGISLQTQMEAKFKEREFDISWMSDEPVR